MELPFEPYNQQEGWLGSGVATTGLQIDASTLVEPLDYYKLFLTDDMVEEHVAETNKHADLVKERDVGKLKPNSRAHKWYPTTAVELLQFIGIILHMGIVRLPKI